MKPRLLDLFSGAGGAARGYQLAGFHVTGVDCDPQPRYAGDVFEKADALTFPLDGFDAVHASPPCHDHSTATGRSRKAKGAKGTGWMLEATISRLQTSGLPWVVENVESAKFPADVHRVKLCGSSFGLDLRRHRWFASNMPLTPPACAHHWQTPRFRSLDSKQTTLASVVGVHGNINYAGEFELRCRAMGIDWMTNAELTQAIPPAYTELVGRQILAQIGVPA